MNLDKRFMQLVYIHDGKGSTYVYVHRLWYRAVSLSGYGIKSWLFRKNVKCSLCTSSFQSSRRVIFEGLLNNGSEGRPWLWWNLQLINQYRSGSEQLPAHSFHWSAIPRTVQECDVVMSVKLLSHFFDPTDFEVGTWSESQMCDTLKIENHSSRNLAVSLASPSEVDLSNTYPGNTSFIILSTYFRRYHVPWNKNQNVKFDSVSWHSRHTQVGAGLFHHPSSTNTVCRGQLIS